MASFTVELQPAPSTPLNLRFGVVYAPRIPAPPFVGYGAFPVDLDVFKIMAFDNAGQSVEVFQGALVDAFYRLSEHLRMDVQAQDRPSPNPVRKRKTR